MKFSKAQARIIRFPEGRICPFHRTHPDQMAIIFTCPECVYVEDPCGCGCDESCEKCEIGEETRYFCDDCGSVYCGKAKCPECSIRSIQQ